MNDEELSALLSHCLDQIVAGKAVSDCLAQYPEHATELEPLLAMAGELGALRDYRPDTAARQRAHARLLRAEVARNNLRTSRWPQPGSFAVSRLAAVLALVLFCLIVATGMVAASRPGDLAYGVRVVAEQAPARLAPGPEARVRAELGVTARRLADLERTMRGPEQDLDQRTMTALLASAGRAAALAASLPADGQAAVSSRLAEHARRIAQLARGARSAPVGAALQAAAAQAQRAAEEARPPAPPLRTLPVGPTPESTGAPAQGGARSPTATAEQTPASGPRATPQPATRPAHTETPPGPGPGSTTVPPVPSGTPPAPDATAPGPGPDVTPQGPGSDATPQGQGPGEPAGPGEPGGSSEEPGGSGDPGGSDSPAH
jgi:hypothetical protein